jgi:hypothetical protein
VRDSRTAISPGYPDLTIVSDHGVIWVELKTWNGRLRPTQREWRDKLLVAGQHWFCWKPSDLGKREIERILREFANGELAPPCEMERRFARAMSGGSDA